MKTLVVFPTYNEKDNIAFLVEGVLNTIPVNVLIVDDNSPDGTGEIAKALADQYESVSFIAREGKLGLGTAHIRGIQYAIEQGFDYVVTMDSDRSHDPKYLPSVIQALETYDVSVGSRYVPGGAIVDWPLSRRLLSKMSNFLINLFLHLQVNDCTSGYRGYRTSLFHDFDFDEIREAGYCFLTEMLYRCRQHQATVGEVPITFCDRRYGDSKISRHELMMSMLTLIRLRFESNKKSCSHSS